jgi:hypothetical protein
MFFFRPTKKKDTEVQFRFITYYVLNIIIIGLLGWLIMFQIFYIFAAI